MTVTRPYDIDYYLETARELAGKVAAVADRIDREREIPPELAGEIADKGFFRLLVPRSLGGSEMDFLDFLLIIEVFAEVDGSTAWCINQNNVFATHSSRIPEQTAKEIWGDKRAVVSNGPPASSARAVPVEGGYMLNGRWNFSTGIPHGTWVAALTPARRANDGDSVNQDSQIIMLLPKKDIHIVDAWHVNGLRGTGTLSFEVDDLFVPNVRTYDPAAESREDGPLYMIPTTLLFASGFATVALGNARASLDAAIDLAGKKTPIRETLVLRDMLTTQRQVGETMAVWSSAKAYLRESVSAVWEAACENHSLTIDDRIQLRLATTYAIRRAADMVDISYNLSGANAIFTNSPLQRRFQDAHVMTQQFQGRISNFDSVGRYYLGLEPEGQF